MLWLSLVFPQLAIESLPGLVDSPEPWALQTRERIVAANPAARILGVRDGLGVSAAQVIAPQLRHRPYDALLQAAALQGLAECALGFSAQVSIEPPQALLLEIGSTLRYFGGLQAVLDLVQAALNARQVSHAWAVAVTPLAALWCARHHSGCIVLPDACLRDVLGALPLEVMHLPERTLQALQGVGMQTLAHCLAMPAQGLALRYGVALVGLLERALGSSPDPRLCFFPADSFSRSIELPLPVSALAHCMPSLFGLLPDLIDWARRHGSVLTRLAVDVLHERQSATRVVVGFAGTRRIEHLQLVLDEHLQRVHLPHPVAGFRLQVLDSEISNIPEDSLLPAAPVRLREGQELMERLRARLGAQAVQGLAACQDHRPELAWCSAEPGRPSDATGAALASRSSLADALHAPRLTGLNSVRGHAGTYLLSNQPSQPRPLWLLEIPRPLGKAAAPVMRYPLRLLNGPERIESGWWDGADVARDYFIAAEPDGSQYWVFRDCRGERQWFLHGVFA